MNSVCTELVKNKLMRNVDKNSSVTKLCNDFQRRNFLFSRKDFTKVRAESYVRELCVDFN